MNWKEFFKLTPGKIVLFVILLIIIFFYSFMLTVTVCTDPDSTVPPEEYYKYGCKSSLGFEIHPLILLMISLVISYLLSSTIIYLFKLIKNIK